MSLTVLNRVPGIAKGGKDRKVAGFRLGDSRLPAIWRQSIIKWQWCERDFS